MFRALAIAVILAGASATEARAQATSLDGIPIAWGESDDRHTTVCAKRWHAIRLRGIRTDAVNRGLGADEQVKLESKAIFSGDADCFTGQVVYRPVAHADVILDALTWVQLPERGGPVPCFKGLQCRWTVQSQSFVEAKIVLDGIAYPETVYVATPRPVQPARIGSPEPSATTIPVN